MLTKASQHNLTRLKYLRQHIKPHPNPPWEKPRFRVKYKMVAIFKPVIYIFFLIAIISEISIVEPHIIWFFSHFFLRDSICSRLKFMKGQTEVIFKVKVKLSLKMLIIYIYFLLNRYRFRTKHRRATYNMLFSQYFSQGILFVCILSF